MEIENMIRTFLIPLLSLFILGGCMSKEEQMYKNTLTVFATRYTAAWCSRNAASVAGFFSEKGSLKINDGVPSIGRPAITKAVQGFMTAFPDLVVKMDRLSVEPGKAVYRWTLTGKNTGSGGTGNSVRISGYEEWTIGSDGLIQESRGHFDEADYQRQLQSASRGK
jgi:predicted ester cyclase